MTSPSLETKLSLYDRDFYLWIQQTAEALKNRDFEQLDWDNLIKEVESMGRGERRELKSRLLVIMEHLLKLMYWEDEKARNARGWRTTVLEQRTQLELLLEDSPSLRGMVSDIFSESYTKARQQAIRKGGLNPDIFPEEAPFSLEQLLDEDFLPASSDP
jgi:hypothetical protein